MNRFHKTSVLAFYNSFLKKKKLKCDKFNMFNAALRVAEIVDC